MESLAATSESKACSATHFAYRWLDLSLCY